MRKLLIVAAALAVIFPALAATPAAPGSQKAASPQPSAAATQTPDMLFRAADAAFKAGNYAEAERLLTIAADKSDAGACFKLFYYYAYGKGLKQDSAKAISFLRRSAESGDFTPLANGTSGSGEAMLQLAWIYEAGRFGVGRDQAEADSWYRRWAKTGDPRAKEVLAARNLQP